MCGNGAGDRTRTYDPIITNDVLYQLSYTGVDAALSIQAPRVKVYFSSSTTTAGRSSITSASTS